LLAAALDDGEMSRDKLLAMIEDSKSSMELIDVNVQAAGGRDGLWKDT
jgi:hypothetical protein